MPEPNTTNIALIVPNTGDLPAAWGTAALNPNFVAIDGLFGGTQTIALAAATSFALSLPSGSITAGGGPNQSQTGLTIFSGTLSGNAVVQLGMPGRYIMHNQCTVGSFYIQVTSSGAGNAVGLPPGQKITLWHDGTNVDFVDQRMVGERVDLHGVTAVPAWMTACTVRPFLIRDGTVYNVSSYPALGAALGSTYGGNGVTTFAVPDSRARVDVAVDPGSVTGRLTGFSGVSGGVLNSAGGHEALQVHNHANSLSDPGHSHLQDITTLYDVAPGTAGTSGGHIGAISGGKTTGTNTTGISINNAVNGSGNSQNLQPCIVSFLPLIKT